MHLLQQQNISRHSAGKQTKREGERKERGGFNFLSGTITRGFISAPADKKQVESRVTSRSTRDGAKRRCNSPVGNEEKKRAGDSTCGLCNTVGGARSGLNVLAHFKCQGHIMCPHAQFICANARQFSCIFHCLDRLQLQAKFPPVFCIFGKQTRVKMTPCSF